MKYLLLLCALGFAPLAWAQTLSNCTQSALLFDFSNTSASGSVSVGGVNYDRASLSGYLAWLESGTLARRFVPTASVSTECDVVPRSNPVHDFAWSLTLESVTSSLPLPLSNSRVLIFVEQLSGNGQSRVTSFTPLAPNLLLADNVQRPRGQGGGRYRFSFALELRASDGFPVSYNATIQPNYRVQSQ